MAFHFPTKAENEQRDRKVEEECRKMMLRCHPPRRAGLRPYSSRPVGFYKLNGMSRRYEKIAQSQLWLDRAMALWRRNSKFANHGPAETVGAIIRRERREADERQRRRNASRKKSNRK